MISPDRRWSRCCFCHLRRYVPDSSLLLECTLISVVGDTDTASAWVTRSKASMCLVQLEQRRVGGWPWSKLSFCPKCLHFLPSYLSPRLRFLAQKSLTISSTSVACDGEEDNRSLRISVCRLFLCALFPSNSLCRIRVGYRGGRGSPWSARYKYPCKTVRSDR